MEKITKHEIPIRGPMRAYDTLHGEILYHRGLVRQELGQTEEAEKDFGSAVELGYEMPPGPSQPVAQ